MYKVTVAGRKSNFLIPNDFNTRSTTTSTA
jgi:hypothetical protein